MKKFTLLVCILLGISFNRASAQCSSCTPVFSTCPPAGGLCNKLDTAYANHMYDKQVNFYMPHILTDPAVIAQCQCSYVQLRAIRVTGVSGLPTGISYTLSQNGQYNVQGGDSVGCSHFCGTPLVPGLYPVTVYLEADVTAIGTPIGNVNQNNNPQQYRDTLLVLPDTVAGVTSFTYGSNGSSACNSITVDLNALYTAPNPNLTRYFWNLGNGQTSQLKTPGVITYTNTSLTKPDTFPVTLTTVFYNYTVKKVHIAVISGGYCGDIEEATCSCLTGADSPDPYIKFPLLGFNNSSSYASNTCRNIDFNNLNLPIPIGTQTVDMEVWDKDNGPPFGSADDNLGSFTQTIGLGDSHFTSGNVDGYITFDTTAGTTITETLFVIANPVPDSPSVVASRDTFCSSDSVRISIDHSYTGYSFEWYRDTVFLTTATDSFFYSNQAGKYKVKVTNQVTGCAAESGWKTVTAMPSPPASISILFNGTSAFITPFPSSGFAADWYFNGNLVTGQNGKFLAFLGNGEYRAELYNTTFPSCRTSSALDTIVSSGINEIGEHSIYGLSVFPNPTHSKFTLNFLSEETQTIVINIQNVLGQSVLVRRLESFSGSFKQDIETAGWGTGLYFIAIETNWGRLNEKIVVN
jgi:hypothetical protein